MRKKEREKKTQDLQKLITAADTNMESRRAERKATKKKLQEQKHKLKGTELGVSFVRTREASGSACANESWNPSQNLEQEQECVLMESIGVERFYQPR